MVRAGLRRVGVSGSFGCAWRSAPSFAQDDRIFEVRLRITVVWGGTGENGLQAICVGLVGAGCGE